MADERAKGYMDFEEEFMTALEAAILQPVIVEPEHKVYVTGTKFVNQGHMSTYMADENGTYMVTIQKISNAVMKEQQEGG